jgi:LuxR family transcriptional regulator, maltose regulon positive regulatory protein
MAVHTEAGMADEIGIVTGTILQYNRAGALTLVDVGSPAWFAWLADTVRFVISTNAGPITVRKEQAGNRRGRWYWRAYRKSQGRLQRVYLGDDAQLTAQAMEDAIARLLAPETTQQYSQSKVNTSNPGAVPNASTPGSEHAPPHMLSRAAPPILRTKHIMRQALAARLEAAVAGPVTLIVAPPGFGKTTLLTQLAQSLPRMAWLTLDAGDNTPERLLAAVCSVLEMAQPGATGDAYAMLYQPIPPSPEIILTQAMQRLAQLEHALILILDDYHVLRNPGVHELMALLLDRMPAQLRLVLSTRTDPPLPLARLRVRGELAEFRAEDLRFTGPESAELVRAVSRRALSDGDAAALEERTEGWAAGLQLAGIALRGVADPAGFIASFSGTHRFVMDYLVDEVLERQPAHLRRFLLDTSILEHLSGSLCDAILELNAAPGGPHSQMVLEDIERQGLFLIALDHKRRWYRYHQLFADVLRAELRRTAGAEYITRLHQRAARWYSTHPILGIPELDRAVRHARAANDANLTAELGRRAHTADLPLRPSEQLVAAHTKAAQMTPILTPRELEVLRFIAAGASNADIATQLVVATSTVKAHINSLFAKLGATNRTHAVAQARALRILP